MSKITEQDVDKLLEFKCARCGADCVKTSILEPDYGYVSQVDQSFVGPLCDACIKLIPKNELAVKRVWATAFLVGVLPDGEGIVLTEDGIEQPFVRSATIYDIESACTHILRDLHTGAVTHKVANLLAKSNQLINSTLFNKSSLKR